MLNPAMPIIDFGGYATRNDLKCDDGRIILKDAFKHNHGVIVPLVWQHLHDSPQNVLGHALLENRDDGVYAYGVFNDSAAGQDAKRLVKHGDVSALSIYANKLKQNGPQVIHGQIREVSLVLAGANPGAYIDNLSFQHGTSVTVDDEEAIIQFVPQADYTSIELAHAADDNEEEDVEAPVEKKEEPVETPKEKDNKPDDADNKEPEKETVEEVKQEDTANNEDAVSHAVSGNKTLKEIFDTMNEDQKQFVYAMVGTVAAEADKPDASDDMAQSTIHEGDDVMKHNVFDGATKTAEPQRLTSEQFASLVNSAKTQGGSFKEAVLRHAGDYGIDNIDLLFPEAKAVAPTPAMLTASMTWVPGVIAGTRHTPFARIKSIVADLTADEARARGYVKTNKKIDQVINVMRRVTTPQTIYKKQTLDRDDVVDITDFDVVAWIRAEMRLKLDEEIARAILIGDGRAADDLSKIKTDNVRPIYGDDELYAINVKLPQDATPDDVVDALIRARSDYRGSGSPSFYAAPDGLVDMLLVKDNIGRRLYNTDSELAGAIRANSLIEVSAMQGITRVDATDSKTYKLIGILVNLRDYTVGADKGGAINLFDDFDIDYNQYKYLIETRVSGALVVPKSAIVIEQEVIPG